MFEFLQESIQENNMLYIENGISTIEDCVYAYETAQTYDDYMLITESLSSSVSAVFQRIADAFQKILDAFRNLFNSKEQEDLKDEWNSFQKLRDLSCGIVGGCKDDSKRDDGKKGYAGRF